MTTIAYRKGVMASDSRSCRGDRIDDEKTKKIWRLVDGSLFGGGGSYTGVLKLLDALKAQVKSKKFQLPAVVVPKTDGLFISPDKDIWLYEKGYWEKLKREFYAIGTGSAYAIVAMEWGASAKEAVKTAMGKDIYSGGRVQALSL